jgi:hypothetical protein
MWVAVIGRKLDDGIVHERSVTVTGLYKEKVIERAIKELNRIGPTSYQIFLGQLKTEIIPPSTYREVDVTWSSTKLYI